MVYTDCRQVGGGLFSLSRAGRITWLLKLPGAYISKAKIKINCRTDDTVCEKNRTDIKPSTEKRIAHWYIQQWALLFQTHNLNDLAKYFSNQSVNESLHG